MFERRPVWFSVTVPQQLLRYLHDLNVDVLGFLREEADCFFHSLCDYCTGPCAFAYIGGHLVSICPTLRVVFCIATPELEANDVMTAEACSDFSSHLQCMLRHRLRHAGIDPNLQLLNMLQVSQEQEFLNHEGLPTPSG
ncbi:E4 ORF2 [simian adenovirus 55]|uniref:E4 ORF2 n=1 Tax=simian adenovirus 55 TaxID=2848082 RepID=A0A1L3INZ6_9ADEN|nr:E4 ORF2 [Simian mastadenovirus WIV19]APG53822.1 E4 ORF2 [Simian mastadenovirus WIV19]